MSNETKEMTKFDPDALVDRVRERVRGSIAELIPEDAWTAMVKKEVDLFLRETVRDPRYGYPSTSERIPSGLAQVVHAVLTEETRKRVKTLLESPEWGGYWNPQGSVSVAVAELVKQNAHAIVQSILGEAVQRFVQELNMRIQR